MPQEISYGRRRGLLLARHSKTHPFSAPTHNLLRPFFRSAARSATAEIGG